MSQNYKTLADALIYFEDIGPKLYELEQQIKDIKKSKEYLKHQGTLATYANREIIEYTPRFKNGYSVPDEVTVGGKTEKKDEFLKKFVDT